MSDEHHVDPKNPFIPDAAVIGIGSLPFSEADEAIAFVAEHSPEIPFWPQLVVPDMVGALLGQVLPPLDRRHRDIGEWQLDDIDLSRLTDADAPLEVEQPLGFQAFVRAARAGAFPSARALKGQVTGPLTVAWLLRINGVRAIDIKAVVEMVADLVVRQASTQIAALETLGHPVIIFVDEPALALVAQHRPGPTDMALLRDVCRAIKQAGATVGLHTCAHVELDQLCSTGADVVSFDALEGTDLTGVGHPALEYWSGGGTLAFGLVPTRLDGVAPTTEALFARWQAAAAHLDTLRDVDRRTLVSATCGLALQTPARAQASFVQAAELSALVRRVARGLDAP